MSYDSRPETYEHIAEVRALLLRAAMELMERAHEHDRSKLVEPELSAFDEFTPKLRETTYGSEEYEGYRRSMGVALQHHYAENRHHPEHFADGIRAMNLLDVLEMLCDWIAASRRHQDGDVRRSIEINRERFGYGDEIETLLLNTLEELGVG